MEKDVNLMCGIKTVIDGKSTLNSASFFSEELV
jgi:hypothetical protein